jgi:phytoene dehydrogenase-like protein
VKPGHHADVVVIGAGHNGLIAAGLLAKRGRRVVVLERRDTVGGAATTETPWGPDFKVTALSYVVSLMPPTILRELELPRHGWHIFPQHGYFAPHADGGYLKTSGGERLGFSARDAEALDRWEAWLGRLGKVLGPLLGKAPPRLGSKEPAELLGQLGLAWRLRHLGVDEIADVTRLMTMSIADLLDDFFVSPAVKGLLAVSGIIGTWAGPRAPGTAFVMAHHQIGDVGDGQIAGWGFPRGGMGGATEVMRRAAEAQGVQVITGASVARILVRDGEARGVALESGDEWIAPVVLTTLPPKTTFLRLVERGDLPEPFVAAIERWRSRSGVVKVNLALDRLPEFRARPGFDPEIHGGTIVLADSLDELETGFQDAVAGQPSRLPFADICIPSVFDDSLAPPGKHVMSMFTQWVPHEFADAPHDEALAAHADRVIARVEAVAPGLTASILHRQIIGPHQMERTYGLVGGNIFHGELSVSQLFHMRPAPGWADYSTPIAGLYQGGSSTHGGGGVTGIAALGAVRKILSG